MLVHRLLPHSFLDLRGLFGGEPLEPVCMASLRGFCMIHRHFPGLWTSAQYSEYDRGIDRQEMSVPVPKTLPPLIPAMTNSFALFNTAINVLQVSFSSLYS